MTAAIAHLRAETVTRLTLEESLECAELAIPDLSRDRSDNDNPTPYPRWVSIDYLKKRFKRLGYGASDHSIMGYRAIAFDEVNDYQIICLARYPQYWADRAQEIAAMSAARKAGIACPVRKKIKPDKLPLTSKQAEIIEKIASLMLEWQDHLIVREQLNKVYKQPD